MAFEEKAKPIVPQQPQAADELVSSLSNDSHLSAPSQKYSNDELKAGEVEPEISHTAPMELPLKPMSEYVTVSLLCLCVAFGGFMFGWDTGTISGFVAQTDFLRRFGMKHKDGTYYLSNVRIGLIVAIFNIGCAFGGIILSKGGDLYGRKKGLLIVIIVYIIGIIIQIASVNKWYQYFIGRIISGLGVGGIAVLCPMLILSLIHI